MHTKKRPFELGQFSEATARYELIQSFQQWQSNSVDSTKISEDGDERFGSFLRVFSITTVNVLSQ